MPVLLLFENLQDVSVASYINRLHFENHCAGKIASCGGRQRTIHGWIVRARLDVISPIGQRGSYCNGSCRGQYLILCHPILLQYVSD
jgi:hypothetical protein